MNQSKLMIVSGILLVAGCRSLDRGSRNARPRPAGVTAASTCPAAYTITDLGVLTGGLSSAATAMNQSGDVAGRSQVGATNGPSHAFSWSVLTGLIDLGTLGGPDSISDGINDHGQVVGTASLADGTTHHAFLGTASTGLTDLGTLGGGGIDGSLAYGINNAGVVVGSSRLSSGYQKAFRWQNGAMADLGGLPNVANSAAYAINDAGQIVGVSDGAADGLTHAVRWSDGIVTDLGGGTPLAISPSGVAVGSGNGAHPVIFGGSGLIDILPAGFERGFANGINDAGQVVLSASHQSGEITVAHGFIYDHGTTTDLNTLTDGSWEITAAQAVNARGQIAATGARKMGGVHALLLTPCSDGEQTIFGDAVPPGYAGYDTQPVALGVRFRSAVAGTITAIRIYRQVPVVPQTIVRLFTSDMRGGELGDGTLTAAQQVTPGWQTVALARPVAVEAGRTYVAWYTDPSGQYSYAHEGLADAVTSDALTAPADGDVDENGASGNGIFAYGDGEVGPPSSYRATNYFVDVVFVPSAP